VRIGCARSMKRPNSWSALLENRGRSQSTRDSIRTVVRPANLRTEERYLRRTATIIARTNHTLDTSDAMYNRSTATDAPETAAREATLSQECRTRVSGYKRFVAPIQRKEIPERLRTRKHARHTHATLALRESVKHWGMSRRSERRTERVHQPHESMTSDAAEYTRTLYPGAPQKRQRRTTDRQTRAPRVKRRVFDRTHCAFRGRASTESAPPRSRAGSTRDCTREIVRALN